MQSIILSLFIGTSIYASEVDFQAAFQKEYAFLIAQKDSLLRQKSEVDRQTKKDLGELETILRSKEREFAQIQSSNEQLFESVQIADRKKKEESNLQGNLAILWKKAQSEVLETEESLSFSIPQQTATVFAPESLKIADIVTLGEKALSLIEQSSKVEELNGIWKAEDRSIKEGKILRFGRVGALGFVGSDVVVLGPDGEGFLKVVETAALKDSFLASLQSGAETIVPLYLFQNLREKVSIKKSGGATEAMADLAPALFLALLFGMVGFLFFQLARI